MEKLWEEVHGMGPGTDYAIKKAEVKVSGCCWELPWAKSFPENIDVLNVTEV